MSQEADDHVVVHRVAGEMLSPTSSSIAIRDFSLVSDEPVSRGGENLGPTPLELMLGGLCGGISVATARAAQLLDLSYETLSVAIEAELDARGRLGIWPGVPLHYTVVNVTVRVGTTEAPSAVDALAQQVWSTSSVVSLMRAAVPQFTITWERAPSVPH